MFGRGLSAIQLMEERFGRIHFLTVFYLTKVSPILPKGQKTTNICQNHLFPKQTSKIKIYEVSEHISEVFGNTDCLLDTSCKFLQLFTFSIAFSFIKISKKWGQILVRNPEEKSVFKPSDTNIPNHHRNTLERLIDHLEALKHQLKNFKLDLSISRGYSDSIESLTVVKIFFL